MGLKKFGITVSLLILLTTFGVIYFSIHTDQEVHNAVSKEFTKNMQEVSRGSVLAIQSDIDSIKRSLIFFKQTIKTHSYDSESEKVKAEYKMIYDNLDFVSVNDIGYIDSRGILKYNATAPALIGMDFSFREYFEVIKKRNDPYYMHVQFITFKGADKGQKGLIFAMGIFENGNDVRKTFKGVTVLTCKLQSFIEKYLKPLSFGESGYTWFFESGGEILYHPKISKGEMYQPIEDTSANVPSIKETVEEIAAGGMPVGEYEEDGTTYSYVTSPVFIGDNKWYIVVSVPFEETYAVLEKYTTGYLLTTLLAFTVIILGIFIVFVFYIRNKKLLRVVDIHKLQLEYAVKTNEELDSIINAIAHDLKTPLTSVMGFSQQILVKSLKEPLDKEDNKFLSKIFFNANYMKDLIDSLIEFSRVGKMSTIISKVDLNEVLTEVKVQLDYIVEQKDAVINTPDNLPTIDADRLKLIQLFSNLISNAIKFVPDDRRPKVDITYKKTDRYHNISVTDNGIGIDKQYYERIFKVFHRTKDLDVPGTGVGLAIVKKIAEDQNASISIKSKKGSGTTFTVSFKK